MKKIILAFLIISSLQGHAQVDGGMPGITDIVTAFFTQYKGTADSQVFYLQFEKRKDGWYVGEVPYVPSTTPAAPSTIFWNKATGTYGQLKYNTRELMDSASAKTDMDSYTRTVGLNGPTLYNYSRNLFYGYTGWDWDVINALQNKPGLTDSLYESLGRACSNYAINYFYNQWGLSFVNNDSDRVALKDSEPIPPSRVNKFRYYENLAIEAYRHLTELNPGYETIIGKIGIKCSNERMFAFTTLRFVGYEKEAAGYLAEITFPDSIMQRAKDMLDEIRPNGIFFTTGDNITYPVWLLQEKGIRKDVIVVDYSLIGLRRVLRYLDKKYNHTLFTADSAVYMNPAFDYARFETEHPSVEAPRMDTFLNRLYTSPRKLSATEGDKTSIYTGDRSFTFTARSIYLPVNNAIAQRLYNQNKLAESVIITIQRDYLYMNDILCFDIAGKNFLKRRIYFSYPMYDDIAITNITQRKYVLELTPEIQ